MTDDGIPIRKQTARLLGGKMSQGQGTLLLYPDKLAHVHSQTIRWASSVGFVLVRAMGRGRGSSVGGRGNPFADLAAGVRFVPSSLLTKGGNRGFCAT
jgi:hypothetical protein